MTSSVPQGSVLGPLLFTIFINDLPDKIKNECKLYADGSKIIGKEWSLVDNSSEWVEVTSSVPQGFYPLLFTISKINVS